MADNFDEFGEENYDDMEFEFEETGSKEDPWNLKTLAKNTKGEVITKFSNEPTNLSNYGFEDDGITRKMSYYEMYPKRKPQITDESEEGN
jgi:hypothetical protein